MKRSRNGRRREAEMLARKWPHGSGPTFSSIIQYKRRRKKSRSEAHVVPGGLPSLGKKQ
jgi:hypothetical protein